MRLRSAEWTDGDDEVGLLHRAALRSAGVPVHDGRARPVIGVSTSSTPLNPCNTVLDQRVERIVEGIHRAGGLAVPFPTMSLGEDLMKPSAMLYRNLLAMEIEEYLRSYPLDGVVLTANCDKTIPAAIMAALSADLPAILHLGGARSPACFRGERLGTSAIWRTWEQHTAGKIPDQDWRELETCLSAEAGACNVMGTASTMAILAEALGLVLPGTSLAPAGSEDGLRAAEATGRRIVELVGDDVRPSTIVRRPALLNAATVLGAIGGSTNAVIHLCAVAGRAGVEFGLEDIHQASNGVPVVADVAPSGQGLIQDLHADGGVPALMQQLSSRLDLSASTVAGGAWHDAVVAPATPRRVIRSMDDPVTPTPGVAVVYGSLAPGGAVIKVSAASPTLLRHRGPALVFDDYHDMRARIEDPDLPVTPATVLVLRGCGPVGVPGMPEWGMVPVPRRLREQGVKDMVRVTDARMSGTSYGTVFLHAAPEAAVGGPLALVRTGDEIVVDVEGRRLDLLVDSDELHLRAAEWSPPQSPHLRGWPWLYRRHVMQAPDGCDLDFLRQPAGTAPHLVPPVVGRS